MLTVDLKVSIIHIVTPMVKMAVKWVTHKIIAFINTTETKPFNFTKQ